MVAEERACPCLMKGQEGCGEGFELNVRTNLIANQMVWFAMRNVRVIFVILSSCISAVGHRER
jgi:hypothetical protein